MTWRALQRSEWLPEGFPFTLVWAEKEESDPNYRLHGRPGQSTLLATSSIAAAGWLAGWAWLWISVRTSRAF